MLPEMSPEISPEMSPEMRKYRRIDIANGYIAGLHTTKKITDLMIELVGLGYDGYSASWFQDYIDAKKEFEFNDDTEKTKDFERNVVSRVINKSEDKTLQDILTEVKKEYIEFLRKELSANK